MKYFSVNSRRISGYLERPVKNRVDLRSALDDIREKLPDTVIFGGMIRDLELGEARRFSSDIDMVSLASDAEIFHAIESFKPQRNKFGGFRFCFGKWRFDIWSLKETWAFKKGFVHGNDFNDLLDTTFFNVDSVIFHLGNHTICASGCFNSGIRDRVLDVNLEHNPSPHGMAKRAMRMAIEHNFSMSAKLVSYVIYQLPSRPPWISEMLWDRMFGHVTLKDEPFQICKQLELLPYEPGDI